MKTTSNKYISLKEISTGYKINSKWAADKWLSQPETLEYLQLWEQTHNINFNNKQYLNLCSTALSYGQSPTISELKSKAHIIGLFTDKNDFENIYLHKDIAINFASWLSPSFQNYICSILLSNNSKLPKFISSSDFIINKIDYAKLLKNTMLSQIKGNNNISSKKRIEGYNYKMVTTIV